MESEPNVFATTRWSVVVRAGHPDAEEHATHQALAELCRIYWRPIFSFVCHRGHSTEDAKDLTQDFFVMILEKSWFQYADESRGRFRSFLLKSLQNFLNHAVEKKHARKRGGEIEFISWDAWQAETPAQLSLAAPALEALAPECLFDLRWAATVVEQALRRLREECESKGRLRVFETLSPHLTTERADVSYANLAAALDVTEAVIKKQLHNLRERYRWLLRDEVTHTVSDPGEVDNEIRHLCAALAALG